jgi:hypothetical protein
MSWVELVLKLISDTLGVGIEKNPNKIRKLYKVDRHQPLPSPSDKEFYSIARKKVSNLKFAILIMSYVMYDDDYRLSLSERYTVRKLMKDQKHFFTKKDHKDIKHILKRKPSIARLIEFAKDNGFDYYDAERTIKLVAIVTEQDPCYASSLEQIHNRFIGEKEYL